MGKLMDEFLELLFPPYMIQGRLHCVDWLRLLWSLVALCHCSFCLLPAKNRKTPAGIMLKGPLFVNHSPPSLVGNVDWLPCGMTMVLSRSARNDPSRPNVPLLSLVLLPHLPPSPRLLLVLCVR